MKSSRLDILIQARIAKERREKAERERGGKPPYDPNGPLDSWEPPKPAAKPKNEVPEIESNASPAAKPQKTPKRRPAYNGKKAEPLSTPLVLPDEDLSRTCRIVITVTPAEDKELRRYVYGRDLALIEWARSVLLEKVRRLS